MHFEARNESGDLVEHLVAGGVHELMGRAGAINVAVTGARLEEGMGVG